MAGKRPPELMLHSTGAHAGRVRDYINTENSIFLHATRARRAVWAAVSCEFLNGARSDSSPWLSAMSRESLPLSVEPAHIYLYWPGMTPDPPYYPIILCKKMFLCPQMPYLSFLTVSDKNASNIHPNWRIQLTFLTLRFLFVWTMSFGVRMRVRERGYYPISS